MEARPVGEGGGPGSNSDDVVGDRFRPGSAFTSALSVSDFAGCLQAGIRPVAFVQGYAVMRWSGGGRGAISVPRRVSGGHAGTTLSRYDCPHLGPFLPGHWKWGENFEQSQVSESWMDGYHRAIGQVMEQAVRVGAHGVVGVVDTSAEPSDSGMREVSVTGTAVVVEGQERPAAPWSCRLGGQTLGKLIEAGYWPVAAVASMASVRMWPVCSTKMLVEGKYDELSGSVHRVKAGSPIVQVSDAHEQCRRAARDRLNDAIGHDVIFGAELQTSEWELREGGQQIDCVLRGTHVRRRTTRPNMIPPPSLMVSLSG
jgi:hypothetical protein